MLHVSAVSFNVVRRVLISSGRQFCFYVEFHPFLRTQTLDLHHYETHVSKNRIFNWTMIIYVLKIVILVTLKAANSRPVEDTARKDS